ncbi:MAG: cytochrome P450 [Cognatishimia sp.]|uniref:cytochrome P450 n=1 Tax=Cognatishimia sp. TaxID=2211648 RepID=UPI004059B4CC
MIPTIQDVTLQDMYTRPYEIYEELRREMPVALLPATGRVLITKYSDARAVKMDAATFTSEDWTTPAERAFQGTSMMRRDGPDHMRERRSIQPALSAKLIGTVWREIAENCADRLLDQFDQGQEIEMFTELAAPFAGEVLAKVLGLLDADGQQLADWSQTLIDGAGNVGGDEEVFRLSDIANDEVNASIDINVARLRETPDASILHSMVFGKTKEPLDRVRCNIKVSIGGGVNEPRDALLTTVYALLTNPAQRAQVTKDPSLFAKALEESVRWVAPIQTSPRKTTEDITLSGVKLPAGTPVSVIQASANRDEDVFENAHLFDINRPEVPHQGFGNGAHFCMGTHLARMSVGQVMLPKLFARFPNMHLPSPEDVPWYGFTFRGPTELKVTL